MKAANERSDRKLRELILYVCKKCEKDPKFGATKLDKILFRADFEAYRIWGRSITEAEYMRLDYGPVPRRFKPIHDQMVSDGDATVTQQWYFPAWHPLKRTIALRKPDLRAFSKKEIELVDKVIEALWGMSGKQLSEISHHFIGWKVADDNETIPYQSILISDQPPSQEILALTRELAEKHKW